MTLEFVMQQAYGVKNYQIVGGPAWLNSDRFDIQAEAQGNPTRSQMMEMLGTLLADRFQLKIHRENRDGPVYFLVIDKSPKLTPAAANSTDPPKIFQDRNTPTDQVGVSYTLQGQNASIGLLTDRLQEMEGRPVLDHTGIQGSFDFKLDYSIENPANPDAPPPPEAGPSIFTAIREQLGLRLEPGKGPVETIVIEHVEKPSAN
jgi:uncharacterized protein (TIGR03435 family)